MPLTFCAKFTIARADDRRQKRFPLLLELQANVGNQERAPTTIGPTSHIDVDVPYSQEPKKTAKFKTTNSHREENHLMQSCNYPTDSYSSIR
ncbi:hypothetical protein CEXT_16121 [Caerostris extrusa]|uniref:Uncharacterized protein n=1 Tax=Caerostris extrusa TaxID=172846 RepID=A0AAV4VDP7_CAEEX|nr:hypothetical protein CEXT_16121 [Caerostris extrusa]